MLQSAEDAPRVLAEGSSLFGPGWRAVESFDDLDEDEYEDEEEELYVVMDLGSAVEPKALQADTSYQLIGLDTPLSFLKVGGQIYQGEVTPLIGDEVIFGLVRNHETPQSPSHPPLYKTSHRLTFRPISFGIPPPGSPPPGTNLETEQGEGESSKPKARRGPVPTRPNFVIEKKDDLYALDLTTMPAHYRITVTEQAQIELNVQFPEGMEPKMKFSKVELEKIRDGMPLRGTGSRRGRGLAGQNAGPKKGSTRKKKVAEGDIWKDLEDEEGVELNDGVEEVEGTEAGDDVVEGADEVQEVEEGDEIEEQAVKRPMAVGAMGLLLMDSALGRKPYIKKTKPKVAKAKGKESEKVREKAMGKGKAKAVAFTSVGSGSGDGDGEAIQGGEVGGSGPGFAEATSQANAPQREASASAVPEVEDSDDDMNVDDPLVDVNDLPA